MWSYLTTRSSLNPLSGYVEDKASDAQCEGRTRLSGRWLLCLAPVMQQKLFCRPQHQLVSYHNDFTGGWCHGFDWKQRS
jgi:hypothetical protein